MGVAAHAPLLGKVAHPYHSPGTARDGRYSSLSVVRGQENRRSDWGNVGWRQLGTL